MLRDFWSTRSELERVDLYTRQTLYVLHVLLVVSLVVALVNDDVRTVEMVGAVVLGVVPNVLAYRALRAAFAGETARLHLLLRVLAAVGALVFALSFLLPEDPRTTTVLLLCLAIAFGWGALRDGSSAVLAVAACAVVAWVPTQDLDVLAFGAGYGGLMVFTVRTSLWLLGVMHQLDRARGAQAALAVAEERLRFSRDVHDVLGRELSTIAVQAELAASLARRGDPTAADRMLDVRECAHRALREARELARGYRATSFEQELDGARSLLRSAGIEMTADADRLPEPWREAAAWVVRETTTNVLRHSTATVVEVRYAGGVLTVVNDRPGAPTGGGTGLDGLRERLTPLGATLAADRTDDAFMVSVTFPEEPR